MLVYCASEVRQARAFFVSVPHSPCASLTSHRYPDATYKQITANKRLALPCGW